MCERKETANTDEIVKKKNTTIIIFPYFEFLEKLVHFDRPFPIASKEQWEFQEL